MSITGYAYLPIYPFVQVTATSDLSAPTFFWYRDGVYFDRTAGPSVMVHLEEGEAADVVAVDTETPDSFDVDANAPTAYPARRTLWWTRSPDSDVAFHRVKQQKASGGYSTVAEVPVGDSWDHVALTPRLDDLSAYDWQIIPVDEAGNEGTALALGPETIVRTPDSVSFDASFDAGTSRVTISGAS